MILAVFAIAVCAAAALIIGLGAVVSGETGTANAGVRRADFI